MWATFAHFAAPNAAAMSSPCIFPVAVAALTPPCPQCPIVCALTDREKAVNILLLVGSSGIICSAILAENEDPTEKRRGTETLAVRVKFFPCLYFFLDFYPWQRKHFRADNTSTLSTWQNVIKADMIFPQWPHAFEASEAATSCHDYNFQVEHIKRQSHCNQSQTQHALHCHYS